MSSFEERLLNAQSTLVRLINELLKDETHQFQYLIQHFRHVVRDRFSGEMNKMETVLHKLIHGSTELLNSHHNRLNLDMSRIVSGLNMLFQQHDNRVKHCDQAIRLLNPVNVLKRGYSITYFQEKALKDSAVLQVGEIIKTKVYKGTVRSKVEELHGEE
jgi:exodeoxyribonuclease VII large subunit